MTRTTCIVITCNATKPTRRYPPGRIGHILDELRIAAAQDRVRR